MKKQCIHEKWDNRELKRQKFSIVQAFSIKQRQERNNRTIKKGQVIENAKDLIKDPYVLEFLKIPEEYR